MSLSAALYIHIPFCEKKCGYCDFYSVPASAASDGRLLDRFVERLCRDIAVQLETFGVTGTDSVYIGGGTPSLLGSRRMKDLLDFLAARAAGGLRPAEFTVEANPESLDEDFLSVCKAGGVTRISCGVQTFSAASRRAVLRQGTVSRSHNALALLNEAYGGAFSADIMSGLPCQDEAALLGDLETLLSYRPAHVSLYDLTLEKNTPLYRKVLSSTVTLPTLEASERLWIAGRDFLEAAGYPQYEVSNFAPAESRSAHNIVYWRMGLWLGAGPSASGTMITDGGNGAETSGLRRTVKPCVEGYVSDAPDGVIVETLDRAALIKETFLMGFRYIEGPDAALFIKRFGLPIESFIPATLDRWRSDGKMSGSGLALNRDGLLMLNRFLMDCFIELDGTI
ncbi:MAG: radical SAM family heme chaperone HemW [Spirochaetaceae bacterium]|jgi:oxygen-independent coproporphyrinogen-3 oxidase|nr:radical SAM family heme chaperone HemW [Spirochaetaceae bacterium]